MTLTATASSVKQALTRRIKRQALDLGLYGRTDYTPFIVLGRSRVGSNLLRGLLNGHPNITAFGEIFRDASCLDWDHTGYFQSAAARSLVREDPVAFIDRRLLGRYPKSIRAVGFKLFYYHARSGAEAAVWPYLQGRGDLNVIHLKRRNLLQTHLSRKRAALTDRWVETSGQPTGEPVVRIDYDECLDDFVRTRAWEEQLDREFAGHPLLQVEYEKLAADYRAQMRQIQEFLDVPRQGVAPSTFKQSRQPLRSMIANYAELKERFAGSVWEEFFAE